MGPVGGPTRPAEGGPPGCRRDRDPRVAPTPRTLHPVAGEWLRADWDSGGARLREARGRTTAVAVTAQRPPRGYGLHTYEGGDVSSHPISCRRRPTVVLAVVLAGLLSGPVAHATVSSEEEVLPSVVVLEDVAIEAGGARSVTFRVGPGVERIEATLVRPVGVGAELISPNGETKDSVMPETEAGATVLDTPTGEFVTRGNWRVVLDNDAPQSATVPLTVLLPGSPSTMTAQVTAGIDSLGIVADLTTDGEPAAAEEITATVAGPAVRRELSLEPGSAAGWTAEVGNLAPGDYSVVLRAKAGDLIRYAVVRATIGDLPPDTTAPEVSVTVSGTAAAGWYADRAVITLAASDPGSRPSGADVIAWQLHDPVTGQYDGGTTREPLVQVPVTRSGTSLLHWQATDRAGNTVTSGVLPTTGHVDGRAPGISVTDAAGALDGRVFEQGQQVAVRLACTDDQSGIAACGGDVTDGATLPTATPGQHRLVVTAKDRVGHTHTTTVAYTVAATRPSTASSRVTGRLTTRVRGRKVVLRISTTVRASTAVAGRVEVRDGGRRLKRVPLDGDGTVTTTVRGLDPGRHRITVRFLGSPTVAPSSRTWVVKIPRRP